MSKTAPNSLPDNYDQPVDLNQDELVLGPAGAGKTTRALAALAMAHQQGLRVVFITPTRDRSILLSKTPQALSVQGVNPVRTISSLAYEVLRIWSIEREDPQPAPVLLSGANEDALVETLLQENKEAWGQIVDPAALELVGLRDQIRSLWANCAELGLRPEQLRELGQAHSQQIWLRSADLFTQMEAHLAADNPPQIPTAWLMSRAGECLQQWREKAAEVGVIAERPQYDLVIVDDGQDYSPVGIELIRQLAEGAAVKIYANPDATVEGYRRADSYGLVDWARSEKWALTDLSESHTMSARIARASNQIASMISMHGPSGRRLAVGEGGSDLPVRLYAHGSDYNEYRWIARQLRIGVGVHGWDWGQQAVIVRDSGTAENLRTALETMGIPVERTGRVQVLATQPAVAPLLQAVVWSSVGLASGGKEGPKPSLASGEADLPLETEAQINDYFEEGESIPLESRNSWSARVAQVLLFSPLIEADFLQLRALVRLIEPTVGVEVATVVDSAITKYEELLTAVEESGRGEELDGILRKIGTVRELLKLAETAGNQRPGVGLWSLWQACGVAEEWRSRALGDTGSRGRGANQDLDAMITLMRRADVWSQRNPEGTCQEFCEEVLNQNLESDSLAIGGQVLRGVKVLTPAAAAGQFFEHVIIAALQYQGWPNLRLRDSLTGTAKLRQICHGIENDDLLRLTLDDELRLFYLACTRAKSLLQVSARSGHEEKPSPFMKVLLKAGAKADLDRDGNLRVTAPMSEFSLRAIVGQARQILSGSHTDEEVREQAEQLLANLVKGGYLRAHPEHWHGNYPLSSEVALSPGQTVKLSPSAIDSILECPLKWFLRSHGGQDTYSQAASVGTLIHALAEEHPKGNRQELLRYAREKLEELPLDDTKWSQGVRDQFLESVELLADYLEANSNCEVLVEERIYQEIGDVIISGIIDRLEITPGEDKKTVNIIDFKTGKRIPSVNSMDKNGQLAAYQLVADQLGYEVGESKLVFVTAGRKSFAERQAPAFTPERKQAATDLISLAAMSSAGPRFFAHVSTECDRCPARKFCPAQQNGEQVIW